MKLNVSNLKTEIKKLNKLINEYEEIYLNLYNELLSSQVYWHDDVSNKFNESISLEKIQVNNTINELTNIKSIYEELVSKYEKIGNKLEFIPKSKDTILSKIDNYLDKLCNLLEIYNEININKKAKEILNINKHISKLKKMEIEVSQLRKKIKEKYELVGEIENNINLKIYKIKLEYINEIDVNKFF